MLLTRKRKAHPLAKDIDKLAKGHGKFVECVVEVPLEESSSSEEDSNQEEDYSDDNEDEDNEDEYEHEEHEDEDEDEDEHEHEDDHEAVQLWQGRGKSLTNSEREAILQHLLLRSCDGVLQRGAVRAIADHHHVHRNTVSSIWKRGVELLANGSTHMDIRTRRHLCGTKRRDRSEELDRLRQIPLNQRGMI